MSRSSLCGGHVGLEAAHVQRPRRLCLGTSVASASPSRRRDESNERLLFFCDCFEQRNRSLMFEIFSAHEQIGCLRCGFHPLRIRHEVGDK